MATKYILWLRIDPLTEGRLVNRSVVGGGAYEILVSPLSLTHAGADSAGFLSAL